MTYRTSEDHAQETSPTEREMHGIVRRVRISIWRKASGPNARTTWQVVGNRGGIGGDEVFDVEHFTGLGFFARPTAGSKSAEAIVLQVGGARVTALIAARDEHVRKLIDQFVGDGETAVFNDKVIALATQDSTFEVSKIGERTSARFLAGADDLLLLRKAFLDWTPVAGDGGNALKVVLVALFGPGPYNWPTPTTVLKGQ